MNKWIKAAALAAALPLAACGSGPSKDDVAKALNAYIVEMMGKQDAPSTVKEAKCEKAADADAFECDFTAEGGDFVAIAGPTHRGRFVKFDAGWKLVGQLH